MDFKSPIGLRRLRQNPHIRELTQEILINEKKLIQPLFAVDGISDRQSISGLTDVYRDTPDTLLRQVESDIESGATKFILFGVPKEKALENFDYSFTAKQVEELRKRFGKNIWISVDVCLCSYTTHGQCGIVNHEGDHILNPESTNALAQAAVAYAQAGADCVAPSDMMDGRIASIRDALDESGCDRTIIMSYAAKFASKFYGPFREAADSAPGGDIKLKDRKSYQLDPTRPTDALLSAVRDAEEGADILMVKPGLPYLDILADLSREIPKPWAVYQVSGEYASIEFMAKEGLVSAPDAHLECWTSFIRAGASMILTYGARKARKWLEKTT